MWQRLKRFFLILVSFVMLCLASCSVNKKLEKITNEDLASLATLPDLTKLGLQKNNDYGNEAVDSVQIVDLDGTPTMLMKTTIDEEGNAVASAQLKAAIVTARFRNVAERHNAVEITFQITVPEQMQDSKWQLRITPDLLIQNDTIALGQVIITGTKYRKEQLKGYQHYQNFLNSIITDSTKFVNVAVLEAFIKRNFKDLYKMKSDSSFVSEEQFATIYGLTEKEAIDHYTDKLKQERNKRKYAKRNKIFRKYVKNPIVEEGIRLDTVICHEGNSFEYNYIETFKTRPNLKKVQIVLSGGIYDRNVKIYDIPQTEPLSFYISSISSFVVEKDRYLIKIIERKAEANASYSIEFPVGDSKINESLGKNKEEIDIIKHRLKELMNDQSFDLDSIMIAAFASPDGNVYTNHSLSAQRAFSASKYFSRFVSGYLDTLSKDTVTVINLVDSTIKTEALKAPKPISFKSYSGGENWDLLNNLIENDTVLSDQFKEKYHRLLKIKNLDSRELKLSGDSNYKYIVQSLYPKLRVVDFKFFLHRKGMVKDTIHTTELDTCYASGVKLLRDRKYVEALDVLYQYPDDINTAIAYLSLDRNSSALAILKKMESTPQIEYLLSILYSRTGDEKNAVQCYINACGKEPSYIHRGNLDPEISYLIKKYGLNKVAGD